MIFGVAMMKNEEDVAYHTVRHMIGQGVTHFVIADNLSTDRTRAAVTDAIAESRNVVGLIFEDANAGYYQSEKMTGLARFAGTKGARWIVPFDADELWFGEDGLSLADSLERAEEDIYEAAMFDYRPTSQDDWSKANPFERMCWRNPAPLAVVKVAFRFRPDASIHQGNHQVTLPGDATTRKGLRIAHFPIRSPEQFYSKAYHGSRAYAQTSLAAYIGSHWRAWGDVIDRHGEAYFKTVTWNEYLADPATLVYDPIAPMPGWRRQA